VKLVEIKLLSGRLVRLLALRWPFGAVARP
jgi:hypothetical protein